MRARGGAGRGGAPALSRYSRWLLLLAVLLGQASTVRAEPLPPPAQRLYELSRSGRWAGEATRLAPAILPTADGRSFYVVWKPSSAPERWVVSLHGTRGFPTTRGARFFSLFVANAGGATLDYPPTRAVSQGASGPRPLAQTRWITVCGERDPTPARDGCPAMRPTAGWLREHGAEIVEAIEDPQADHGVFHRTPRHVGHVLDLFGGATGVEPSIRGR